MKSLLLIASLFIGFNFTAQQSPKNEVENTKDSTKIDYNAVFEYVEEEAEYIGGFGAMMKFIQSNLVYPGGSSIDIFEILSIKVKFIVEKNGTLSEIEGLNKNPEIRKLHQDIFAKMPPWKPAKQNGIVVRQQAYISMIIHVN